MVGPPGFSNNLNWKVVTFPSVLNGYNFLEVVVVRSSPWDGNWNSGCVDNSNRGGGEPFHQYR